MEKTNLQIEALHELLRTDDTLYLQVMEELGDFEGKAEIAGAFSEVRKNRSTVYDILHLADANKKVPSSPSVQKARLRHMIQLLLRHQKSNAQSVFGFDERILVLNDHLLERGIPLQNIDVFNPFYEHRAIPEHVIRIATQKLPVTNADELVELLAKADENEDDLNDEERQNLEVFHLIENMEANYRRELDRLEFYELVDENTPSIPSFSEVMATFSGVDLMRVVEHNFQEPKLILVPPIPLRVDEGNEGNSLEKAIDKHETIKNQGKSYVRGDVYDDSAPNRWQAFIVEGAIEMDAKNERPDLDETKINHYLKHTLLGGRIRTFLHNFPKGVRSMDRWRYAHLMMAGLMEGQPIDQKNYTLLTDDPVRTTMRVPCAGWSPRGRKVDFFAIRSESPRDRARFRRSVGGDVPMN